MKLSRQLAVIFNMYLFNGVDGVLCYFRCTNTRTDAGFASYELAQEIDFYKMLSVYLTSGRFNLSTNIYQCLTLFIYILYTSQNPNAVVLLRNEMNRTATKIAQNMKFNNAFILF